MKNVRHSEDPVERKVKAQKTLVDTNDASMEELDVKKVKKEKIKKTKKNVKNTLKAEKEEKRGKYEKVLAKKEKVRKIQEKKEQNETSTEKPNWPEFKKQRKELKEKRKAKKLTNIYEITTRAKQIGEKLRRSDCSPEERSKSIAEMHEMLKSHYSKVVFAHDMSRIVQWLIRYSSSEIRLAVLNELKPCLVNVLQSKYAKNCMRSMLKYGSQEVKSAVISACYGNVIKLFSHTVSAPLMEAMYSTWAGDVEKLYFKQEFYGDMYKRAKDKDVKSVTDVYRTSMEMKPATLSAIKGNLIRILNKKLIGSALLHTILFEFLTECSNEDRSEIIVMLRDLIVELSKTKYGAKAAMICIWHGTNKDRKIIMKALKDNVKDVCISEHGHMVLLSLFDVIDDTVLLKKIILSEVQDNLTDIALNDHGKHVILYLVARRNSHYFPPSIVKQLEQGDNNVSSKKPADIREKELLEAVRDPFLESVAANANIWFSNSSISMVSLAILKIGAGEVLKQAFESVAVFLTDPKSKIKEGDVEHDVVEQSGLHMVLKKLIQHDKELSEKGECTFGQTLVNHLTEKIIKRWITVNRGCFLLVFLIENEPQSVVDKLISKLNAHAKSLKSVTHPGAKILLKKLQ